MKAKDYRRIGKDKMRLDRLLCDIERYFNCDLSDAEEETLRREIATTEFEHPAVIEACVVMGVRRPVAKHQLSKRRERKWMVLSMVEVAAIFAVVAICVNIFCPPVREYSCVAYVNGQRVTDEEMVIALMARNAAEFNDGAEDVRMSVLGELEFIAPVVERYESEEATHDI